MDKKKLYILIGAAVVVIIAIIIGVVLGSSSSSSNYPSGSESQNNPTNASGAPITGPGSSATWNEVPKDIVIPDQNTATSSVSKDIAIPSVSIPSAPGVSATLRVFNIKGEGGLFTPSTVAAYTGDTVHINFTAVDKTYDITFPDYNMKQTAQKGQTKVLEFQAQAVGKFAYYCDACGGLNSKALGYIIVAPAKAQ